MEVIGTDLEVFFAVLPASGVFLDGEEINPSGADGRGGFAAKVKLPGIVLMELGVEMGFVIVAEDVHCVPEILLRSPGNIGPEGCGPGWIFSMADICQML